MWTDLLARPSGPFAFRFVPQPLIAALFAIRDGIKDGQADDRQCGWAVLRDSGRRRGRIREGPRATARVIAFGIAIDARYQFKVLGTFYPGEAATITWLLGFGPYVLSRGPAARIARRRRARTARSDAREVPTHHLKGEGDRNGDIDQAQHPRHLG